MAVIRGTNRGAFRRGRYAIRSNRTATTVETVPASTNQERIESHGCSSRNPERACAFARKAVVRAPNI